MRVQPCRRTPSICGPPQQLHLCLVIDSLAPHSVHESRTCGVKTWVPGDVGCQRLEGSCGGNSERTRRPRLLRTSNEAKRFVPAPKRPLLAVYLPHSLVGSHIVSITNASESRDLRQTPVRCF